MKLQTKKFCIFVFGITFASASIIIPFIYVLFSIDYKPTSITFTPSYIKSFPNHTAWILAEINIPDTRLLNNFSIDIYSNESIAIDTKIWDNEATQKVIEIFVSPNSTHLNHIIEVEVWVNNSYETTKSSAMIEVVDWMEKNISEIIPMKEIFVSYLSVNKPSFFINESTIWVAFDNAPQILIVEHYLFRSEYWEMELSRHVMIDPYDWIKVYLRPRNHTCPIWAGIISSWNSGNYTIIETEPPLMIYR